LTGLVDGAQAALNSLDLATIAEKLGGPVGTAVQESLQIMSDKGILTGSAVTTTKSLLSSTLKNSGMTGLNAMTDLLKAAGVNAGYLAN